MVYVCLLIGWYSWAGWDVPCKHHQSWTVGWRHWSRPAQFEKTWSGDSRGHHPRERWPKRSPQFQCL